jgi:hypothetical protein
VTLIEQEVDTLGKGGVAPDVGDGVLKGAVDGYCPQFQQALTTWVNSEP